jgi:hypothetical protein
MSLDTTFSPAPSGLFLGRFCRHSAETGQQPLRRNSWRLRTSPRVDSDHPGRSTSGPLEIPAAPAVPVRGFFFDPGCMSMFEEKPATGERMATTAWFTEVEIGAAGLA